MSAFAFTTLASLSPLVRFRAPFAALAFLFCLSAAGNTFAANFVVTRTDDRNTTCNSGVDCSLREAVNAANAAATNDTISFLIPAGSAGCTAGVCTITLTLGELAVASAATAGTLTITNSTGASNLLISGNNTSRVFFVNSGANLATNGVTITKGNATGTTNTGNGGGILNLSGTLTLTNSTVSGNTATQDGGGISNYLGALTLTNSTVSGNTSASRGGGIYRLGGTTTLTNSTVSDNAATGYEGGGNSGGGIFNNGISGNLGATTLTDSIISGNTASGNGGIYNSGGTLNLTSVTVTRNKSTDPTCTTCAGGIKHFGTATLNNTIVAGNTIANASASPFGNGPDFSGAVAAGSSYNLIGSGQGTTGVTNGDANNNQVGVDPKLDPTLKLNGGTTPNHALLAGSPAIDRGNSFGLTTDQRGFLRPADNPTITNAPGGDGSDIGAFEVQLAPTAATVSISGRVTSLTGGGIMNVHLSLTDSRGQVRTAVTTAFGYYRFDDVQAGETYILSATGKHYTFSQPTQVLNINEETNGVDFIVYSEKKVGSF